jgi:hypothetical protein
MTRPRRTRLSRSRAEALGRAGAQSRGCTCQPDYRVWHDEHGITYCTVAHDHWCAALTNEK